MASSEGYDLESPPLGPALQDAEEGEQGELPDVVEAGGAETAPAGGGGEEAGVEEEQEEAKPVAETGSEGGAQEAE